MKVELTQGTNEWRDYRRTRITATDFCVIAASKGLCTNLFNKSIDKLIKDKITATEAQQNNPYFNMGHKYEPLLLDTINLVDLRRSETYVYDNNLRIMASLDGRDDFTNRIIEIKTTKKSQDKLQELIDYYKYQVMHQCYVANCDNGLIIIGFVDDFDEVIKIEQVEIIPQKIMTKKEWLEHCEEFLQQLDNANKCPDDILTLYIAYDHAKGEEAYWGNLKDEMKQQIIDKLPNGGIFKEFALTKSSKTTIKYKDVIDKFKILVTDEFKTTTESFTLKGNKK